MMNLGKGYLTYTLAIGAVVWAVAGFAFGWVDQATAVNVAWVGLSAFGLRRAIK